MAPKKAASKGKGLSEEAGTSWMKPALSDQRVSTKSTVRRVRWVLGMESNEWGGSGVMPANKYKDAPASFYPIFLHTMFPELIPLFSEFLLAVLEYYQI